MFLVIFTGWLSNLPWENQINFKCDNNRLIELGRKSFGKDFCNTRHAKGYRCDLTTNEDGSYYLKCKYTSENHVESGLVHSLRENKK